MKLDKKSLDELLSKMNVVGVADSPESAEAARTKSLLFDFIEWRIDRVRGIDSLLRDLGKPVILTPRDHTENGAMKSWRDDDRKAIYRTHMHGGFVSMIDVEAALVGRFMDIVDEAKKLDVGIILSAHFFDGMPMVEYLERLWHNAVKLNVDVLKIAVKSDDMFALQALVRFALVHSTLHGPRIVIMLMGNELGKLSRLVAAKSKMALVYCCFGQASVPGQWTVEEFEDVFSKL